MKGPARRPPSAVVPLLALLLVLASAATAAGLPATHGSVPTRVAPAAQILQDPALSAAPLVVGSDACALLPDEDVLLVTGGRSIVDRIPGSRSFLAAGCQVSVEPEGDAFGTTWDIFLGVEPTGGPARYDQDAEFVPGTPVAGIGDRASHQGMFDSWSAVTGDTYLTLQVVAFGGDKPRSTSAMGRLLLWRAVTRLEAAGSGAVPVPSPSPSPVPVPVERALVERIRAPGFGPDVVDAAIELLARSGIATYDAPGDPEPIMPITEPASPMALLRDQVQAMALEAWAGGGFSGDDLDALVPARPELAGGAEIVAGYLGAVDTEGARIARELVGETDKATPARLVVPQLVLVLLVSDIARETRAVSVASARSPPQPVRAIALAIEAGARTAQGGPCSTVLGFVDGVISAVFDALRLGQQEGTVAAIVVTIWNFVVSLAESAARKIIKQLTQPVLDLIAEVAAAVGLASMIVSAVRPWALSITADPVVAVKGVGGSPGQPGRWIARVDLGGFDKWPEAIQDCATAAGRPLPNLKPEGAPVTWSIIGQQPGDLVIAGTRETALDAQGTARFEWTTGADTLPEPWQERPGWIGVSVRVDRPQLRELRQLAIDELLAQIPTLVRGPLVPVIRPVVDRLTARLDTLLSSQSSGQGTVVYHVPGPSPEPGETPPPSRAVMVRRDRAAAFPLQAGRVLDLVSCTGPYGAWTGVLRLGGMSAEGVEVPFTDFPMAFAFPGGGGVRATDTSIAGTVDTNIPNLSYDITADLRVVTDGRTLTITGAASGQSMVVGITAELGSGQLRGLPIQPAPAGTCP